MDWQSIETAPKDGTPIWLKFSGGRCYVRAGTRQRRIELGARVVTGKWWSAADAIKAVGRKKASSQARGALIAKNGGYWGSAGRHSQPMTGHPTHWMPVATDETFAVSLPHDSVLRTNLLHTFSKLFMFLEEDIRVALKEAARNPYLRSQ